MGQFKPMVKMYTDEPSVSLKLKKGGKVSHKAMREEGHGHKSMSNVMTGLHGAHHAFESEHGKSPKKPSMAERRKAMNPNLYKKGGKVRHKEDGGTMGGDTSQSATSQPDKQLSDTSGPQYSPPATSAGQDTTANNMASTGQNQAVAATAAAPMARPNMRPVAPMGQMDRRQMGQRPMVRSLPGTVTPPLAVAKKGGKITAAKVERELKAHEAKSMSKAHHKASGGAIDRAETRTTIESGAGKYAKTKMDTAKRDRSHGTGYVCEGKPGGYKFGGTIEGNEGKFVKTKVDDGSRHDSHHGSGGVKMGNAGGFKHGGRMAHKASGGSIDRKLTRTTVEGGNWENRAANTAKAGKSGTRTGEVKEANAGGFKHGGHAAKKAYATGGNVIDDGKAQKMPHHFVSQPVANTKQSGTFKRGGKVHHHADGGSEYPSKGNVDWEKAAPSLKDKYRRANEPYNPNYSEEAVNKAISSSNRSGRKISGKEAKAIHSLLKGRYADGGLADSSKGAYDKSIGPSDDDMDMARAIRSFPSRLYDSIKEFAGMGKEAGAGRGFINPPGAVTKTRESVTVSPGKKRGGRC